MKISLVAGPAFLSTEVVEDEADLCDFPENRDVMAFKGLKLCKRCKKLSEANAKKIPNDMLGERFPGLAPKHVMADICKPRSPTVTETDMVNMTWITSPIQSASNGSSVNQRSHET